MPRSFVFAGKMARLALVLWISACSALALRADQPANPLRPGPTTPVLRVNPVPTEQSAVWHAGSAEEEPEVGLPSVVPPGLGQPELLPSPGGKGVLSFDHFGEPDFQEGAPWQEQMHPLFAHPWF